MISLFKSTVPTHISGFSLYVPAAQIMNDPSPIAFVVLVLLILLR